MSGRCPSTPNTLPTILSFLVILGSIIRPTAINPPGTAYNRGLFYACKDTILDLIEEN